MSIYVFKSNISSPTSTLTCTANLSGSIITPTNEDGTTPVILKSISTMNVERTSYINIFLSSLGINWQPNTTYSFVVSSGFLTDLGGGDNQAQTLYLQTPATGPQYQSVSVDNNSNITITFNKKIYKNTGSISVYSTTGTLLGTTNTVVSTTGTSISYKAAGLLRENTSFYITAPSGIVIDDFLLSSSAITGNTASFTTSDQPQFHGLNANLQSNSSIVVNAVKYHGLINCLVQSSLTIIPTKRHSTAQANLQTTSTILAIPNNLSFEINVPNDNFNCQFFIGTPPPVSGNLTFIVFWGDGFNTTYNVGYNSGQQFSHTYISSGLYVITVSCGSNSIAQMTFPRTGNQTGPGIVTRILDWGVWYPGGIAGSDWTGIFYNFPQLTKVPSYLPNVVPGRFNSLFEQCTIFNDPNVKQWFSRNGTTTQGNSVAFTNQAQFGSHSLSLGTVTSDYIAMGPGYDRGNFIIEFFFYPTSSTANAVLVLFDNFNLFFKFNQGYISVNLGTPFNGGYLAQTGISTNQWHHIAFKFVGGGIGTNTGNYSFYVDGSLIKSGSGAGTMSSLWNFINGYTKTIITPNSSGYIDELRISKDHGQSISVPSAPYSSDKYTMLLLHFNNSIYDSSSYDGLDPIYSSMDRMFQNCPAFNQDLSAWNVPSVNTHADFSTGATNWSLPKPTFS
jgi:surface protein